MPSMPSPSRLSRSRLAVVSALLVVLMVTSATRLAYASPPHVARGLDPASALPRDGEVLRPLPSSPELASTSGGGAFGDRVFVRASSTQRYPIPDALDDETPGFARSSIAVTGAPDDAVVTDIRFSLVITHTFMTDLIVKVTNASGHEVTTWHRQGQHEDSGFDDDPEYDGDIERWETWERSAFRGDPVNQNWHLDVWDLAVGDEGFIDSFALTIFYDSPSMASRRFLPCVRRN